MKYIIAMLYVLLYCGISVSALGSETDSLVKVLKKRPNDPNVKLDAGLVFLKVGNIDTAEILFIEAAKLAASKKDFRVLIKAQMNIGRIYADKGENVKALHYYQQALSAAEKIQDKALIAHLFKNVGALYVSWKKFDNAISYYSKAEKMAAEVGDEELIADCQNNKGTVYEQQKKYEDALVVYKNALDIYTRKNISSKVSMALSNIAIVYKFQKKYEASLAYNFKALALATKLKNEWFQAAIYNNIGNLYGEMGDYKKALSYCEKALALAKKIDALEIIESTYDSMSEAAATAGDYEAAFKYHKQFSDANYQFINVESTRQLSELNVKFETEKKQALIRQQQFEITKKNYWIAGTSVLLILVFAIGYLAYLNNRNKQERRLQAEQFKQQELAGRSLFEGEQKERIRIARDLHDSIGQMLAVLKMKLSATGTIEKDAFGILDKTINEVRNISHNLIPEALNFGLINAIEDLADKIRATGKTNVITTVSEQAYQYEFSEQNALLIYRIVQEVLGNMAKHAEASEIKMDILKYDDQFVFNIEDNGKGFDVASIKQSAGLGWKNISARLHLLNGSIQVTSEQAVGTTIKIIIPV